MDHRRTDAARLQREGRDGRLGVGVHRGLAAAHDQQVLGDPQPVTAGRGEQVGAVGVEQAVDGVGAVGAGQQPVGGHGARARVVRGVGLVDRILTDPLAPPQVRAGRQVCVRVRGGAGEEADAAGAGVGQVVEDVEDGGLVVVVHPRGDRERAGRAAVGDDRQALSDQLADHRILVGRVDDDRAVQSHV